jgi:hypothetical protein
MITSHHVHLELRQPATQRPRRLRTRQAHRGCRTRTRTCPEDIIKLASNENPLGPSPKAHRGHAGRSSKKCTSIRTARRGSCATPSRKSLASKWATSSWLRQPTRSSSSSATPSSKPGDNIITAEHAFLVYKLMAKVFGADTIEVPDPGYVHDLDAMAAAITPQTKEIFIANPNNPTGTLVTQEQIDRFMAKVPDHVVVVFDEAYYEFLDNPPDTLKYVREGRNVVVLRTFSKIQGLAGTPHRLRDREQRVDRRPPAHAPALQHQLHRPGRRAGRVARSRAPGQNQAHHR